MPETLLSVQNLKKYFKAKGRTVYALDDISFDVEKGKTYGLVGESGCGKTTAGRTVLRLLEPTSGKAVLHGEDIFRLRQREMKKRRRQMQMVFQDPYAALNPRKTIGDTIVEMLDIHHIGTKAERKERMAHMLDLVGLRPSHATRYPHEFSGGQRQRVVIARALVLEPELVICDEPVSALDVSVQSQILNLLEELQDKLGLTYIFIAHGLNVVRHISQTVGVMYLGKLVEEGDAEALFQNPLHPYTQALISAVPVPDPEVREQGIVLEGDIPSPMAPPEGCYFSTRCPYADKRCREAYPEMRQFGNRRVSCHKPLGVRR